MISVIDYGVVNIGSLLNMLRKCGIAAQAVTTPCEVENAEKLILPGVGSFDTGVKHLRDRGLVDAIRAAVADRRTPILGICLGMQLLGKGSEEGGLPGLGLVDASCVRFRFESQPSPKIPHMGWESPIVKKPSGLLSAIESRSRFYFTHSYHMVCAHAEDVAATALYGLEFTAVIERGHVRGVQFHPEKSHRFGMALLKSYEVL